MIVNYISENIKYFYKKSELSQDDFGLLFDVGKGLVSNYINNKALPKIETIQKICNHYEILIDDFVNEKLSELQPKNYVSASEVVDIVQEPPKGFGFISLKYVELLENSIFDKEKIIKELEQRLQEVETKRKQA